MSKIIKILFIVILAMGLVYFFYRRGISSSFDSSGENIAITIEPGESVEIIGDNLEKAGAIKSGLIFKFYVWRTKNQANIQAGEYLISPSMNIKSITEQLVRGDTRNRERTIKILEGWTIKDIDKYLVNEGIVQGDEFLKLTKTVPVGYDLIELPSGVGLEGYLFPDTYRIYKDADAEAIVAKLLGNLAVKLTPEIQAEIKRQGKNIHEIITLASIIEKEVHSENDRAIVAGILYKRLNIGMRLEVDSSINYITGKKDPQALSQDLEIDSPYNTYKYYGLPPGPISNPGVSAIMAAVYPEDSQYLFYLNRLDTGETIFSKTYEEHLKNKAKYLN